jgi:hypothetical protein
MPKTRKSRKVKVRDMKPKKGARGGGRVQMQDMNVVKYSDKASAKLML